MKEDIYTEFAMAAKIKVLENQLKGADERIKMVSRSRDEWKERAEKAEMELVRQGAFR